MRAVRHLRRQSVLMLLGLLLIRFQPAAYADDGPTAEVMSHASSGVVQVIARQCASAGRTGSGFLLESPSQVVTALHVISGCQRLFAYFNGVGEVPAKPIHMLPSADLAMLSVTAPASAHPLLISSKAPQVNDILEVIGYYFGVPTLDSRPLHVTLGSPILGDMVPDSVRRQLQDAGSPKLSTQILRLDGNLLPGLSGAPLIDAGGGIVGVGSGGLENGTVGVSWAIQAHYLSDLKSAGLVAESPRTEAASLYAAPAEGKSGNQVHCGDFVFAYLKTRSLKELLSTADDIPGLMQIAATTGMSNDQLNAIEFDIYVEQNSGGSVALPKGAHLARQGDQCIARIAEGLDMTVGSSRVANALEVQQRSVNFETAFDPRGLVWGLDPSFSYIAPLTRPDGLVVRRKNLVGFVPPGALLAGDAFETLMTRGTTFVGIRVTNVKYNPPLFQQCHWQPAMGDCAAVNTFFAAWVATAVGVQMSTFPPG
jgi:Trypsin-like peptidase domain